MITIYLSLSIYIYIYIIVSVIMSISSIVVVVVVDDDPFIIRIYTNIIRLGLAVLLNFKATMENLQQINGYK